MKNFTKIQNEKDITNKYYVDSQTDECVKFSDRGEPDGIPGLGSDGKVPYSQLPDFVKSEDKGVAGGVASLGDDGKVPNTELPIVPIENGGTGANNAEDARANLTAAKIGHYFARATWSDYGYHVTIPEITELFDGTIVTIETDSTNPNTGYLQINDLEKIKLFKRSAGDTYREATLGMDIYWIGAKAIITFVLINHSFHGRIFLPIQTIPSRRDIGGVQRASRITVGTSTNGWTYADCDSLCDGTNDTTVINNAIEKLPTTGGEIIILDGTYNLTDCIKVNKDNVTLTGNGQSTILKRGFVGKYTNPGLIYITSSYNTIQSLALDGAKDDYNSGSTGNNMGLYFSNGSNNIVTKNICNNCLGSGICFTSGKGNIVNGNICNNNRDGIYFNSGSGNIAIGNICDGNSMFGISTSEGNTVTENICNNGNHGIYIERNNNVVTANICKNNTENGIMVCQDYSYYSYKSNTITGNVCNNNQCGIYIVKSENNSVSGNTCNDNDYGIRLQTKSNNNTITGNTCVRGSGTASDYSSSQHTIYIINSSSEPAQNNLISNNNIMGKDCTGAGVNNTFANNKYN